jgi:TetR/AcrR family transcriptional regulator, regulator of autoinduction and epiphytic fitness
MADAVKPSRRYESPKRQEQARATRRAIVEAARALFLARGYAQTTIEAIAREAGVAVQTVYAAFGSKPEVLKTVIDVAVAGHDTPAALVDDDALSAIGDEPDLDRRVRMFAALLADVQGRTAAVAQVAREAASADREAAEVWRAMQASRAAGMAEAARSLAGVGPGTLEQIADVLYVLTSPEVYQLFVVDRLWTPERYREWLVESVGAVVSGRRRGPSG